MKRRNSKLTTEQYFQAAIIDHLKILIWLNSADGQKGENRPKLILDSLNEPVSSIKVFTSGEEFEKEKQRIIERSRHGH